MTAVSDLVALLGVAGVRAEWQNTGGGCYAIVLPFKGAEILVTDREDVFSASDYDSDADVWGFFVRAYRLDSEGCRLDDDDNDGWIYTTPDDAGACESHADPGEKVVDLSCELDEVFASILTFVDSGRVGNVALEAV